MFKLRLTQLLILLVAGTQTVLSQSEVHRLPAIVTDASVTGLYHSNGYTLIKGVYYQSGQYSGSVVVLDDAQGQEDLSWPVISGEIRAVVPDGNGGWYVGGYIYGVNNEDVGNLVHILPNKTLDRTWLPSATGMIYALKIKDGILYVGGTFVSMAGQTRYYAAAFNTGTGALTDWNPHPDNRVTAIEVGDNAVYLAGLFNDINDGATVRSKLAAVDKTTGMNVASWNVTLAGTAPVVEALALSSSLFIGGSFDSVNGIVRNGLAAVSLSTGSTDGTWAPEPMITSGKPKVSALLASGNTLYVGGAFNAGLGGDNTIKSLGAVSTSGTGAAINNFKPVFDQFDQIKQLTLVNSTLYVAGTFNSINGLTRYGLAGINTSNGLPTDWAPHASASGFFALASTPEKVVIAGEIRGANWDVFNGIALVDESTGTFWPHTIDPGSTGDIYSIVVLQNTLYVAGRFSTMNGTPRKNLAAIDLSTGNVLPWNPEASGTISTFDDTGVFAMDIKDNTIYIGGKFLTVGGQNRRGLAAVDAASGSVTGWNPGVGDGTSMDEYPSSIRIHDDNLYIVGTFSTLSGQPRSFIGAVDLESGAATSWSPEAISEIRKIDVSGNTAYIMGEFSDGIAGAFRNHGIAAIDLTSGEATTWDPEFNASSIGDFALTDTDIYVGSYYESAEGEPRPGLSSFSLATGELNPWHPDLGSAGEGNYDVQAVAASPSRLYVGGSFLYMGNEFRGGYAEYELCSATATITLEGSTLIASAGSGHQWFANDVLVEGATSQTFDINVFEYGRYAVQVTSNGCTARSGDYVYLVTENEEELSTQIKYFPNPVEDQLFIEVPVASTLTVYDLAGRPVVTAPLSFNEHNVIPTAEWTKGAYVLKVQNHQFTQSFKIIKTK